MNSYTQSLARNIHRYEVIILFRHSNSIHESGVYPSMFVYESKGVFIVLCGSHNDEILCPLWLKIFNNKMYEWSVSIKNLIF